MKRTEIRRRSVDLQVFGESFEMLPVPLVGLLGSLHVAPFQELVEQREDRDWTDSTVFAASEHELVKADVRSFAVAAEIEASAIDRYEPGVTVLTEPWFGIAGHELNLPAKCSVKSPERAEKFAKPSGSSSYLGALLYRILYQRRLDRWPKILRKPVTDGSDWIYESSPGGINGLEILPGKQLLCETRGTESGTVDVGLELDRISAAWPKLPRQIKALILHLVELVE